MQIQLVATEIEAFAFTALDVLGDVLDALIIKMIERKAQATHTALYDTVDNETELVHRRLSGAYVEDLQR